MIDNTDKNINNDEFSDILDSIRHIQVFDDELGVSLPFMQMDCFVCKNEQSMIMLLDDQGKICYDNFYCRTCNVGNATKDSMKRYIVTFRKIINSLLKFPDETFAARIEEMKEYQPNIVQMVHELIREIESGNPVFIDLANGMRRTRTYKAYPKSLGDENRLFMTISSYFERFRHRFEGKNGDQQFDEFIKLVKQDQV